MERIINALLKACVEYANQNPEQALLKWLTPVLDYLDYLGYMAVIPVSFLPPPPPPPPAPLMAEQKSPHDLADETLGDGGGHDVGKGLMRVDGYIRPLHNS